MKHSNFTLFSFTLTLLFIFGISLILFMGLSIHSSNFEKINYIYINQTFSNSKNGKDRKKIAFVTSFYYFPESKRQRHPTEYYKTGFSSLLGNISKEIDFYMYTNDLGLKILELNTTKNNFYINLTYKSPYDICNISKYKEKYTHISNKYHIPSIVLSENLGAIWNSKICLLEEVSKFPNEYEYIFWIDTGIIKQTNYTPFKIPFPQRVEKIFSNHSQFLVEARQIAAFETGKNYVPMHELNPDFGNLVASGFFGGKSESIKKAKELFFEVHDIYLRKDLNIVREENVFNALLMYYPQYFMGFSIKSKNCCQWDCGPTFLSDNNNCGFDNQLIFIEIKENKFVIKRDNLEDWL